MNESILAELKEFSDNYLEMGEFSDPTEKEMEFYQRSNTNFISAMYMPHDYQYLEVLKLVDKNDIVIDMGTGDFRLAILLSKRAKKVYALELNPELVSKALNIIKYNLPSNLIVICADWVKFPIPNDVNLIICLCNSPIMPESWHNYKRIVGLTNGIRILNKQDEKL